MLEAIDLTVLPAAQKKQWQDLIACWNQGHQWDPPELCDSYKKIIRLQNDSFKVAHRVIELGWPFLVDRVAELGITDPQTLFLACVQPTSPQGVTKRQAADLFRWIQQGVSIEGVDPNLDLSENFDRWMEHRRGGGIRTIKTLKAGRGLAAAPEGGQLNLVLSFLRSRLKGRISAPVGLRQGIQHALSAEQAYLKAVMKASR